MARNKGRFRGGEQHYSLYRLAMSSYYLFYFLNVLRIASLVEHWQGNNRKLEEPYHDTRSKIYEHIRTHPGTHMREISREMGLAMGDLQYHLYGLEKQGRIKTRRIGLYKFIFTAEIFGERQSVILSILTQETPRELLLRLIEKPESSQSDLAKFTELSAPTISWHMKRLVDQGIVERVRKGKIVTFKLLEPVGELGFFLQSYHPNIWQKWSSRLADIFLVLSEGDKKMEGDVEGDNSNAL